MVTNHLSRELSSIAHSWLRSINIKVNSSYTNDAITTHPDYPALTSLTDFLESGGMAYDAVQADAAYINEFNYPLLAHIKQPGNEYLHLINDASVWDKEKAVTVNWSGIALYATKGATWHNEENDAAEKAVQKNKYIAAAFVIAGLALFAASVFIYSNTAINIFGLLSLAGLAISIAALGTELGYESKIVKQVCGTVGNGGCEKVLGSKFAKGFAGITPADASVLYFAAQFIMYLIGCFYTPLLSTIIVISFAGIAVAVWSIYTQAVKVKEWCALCLCIVAVLVGQIIIASYLQYIDELIGLIPNPQFLIPFASFPFTLILLSLIYLPIKQLIKTNTQNKQELRSFKKWKTDASLFLIQLEKEPSCDNTIWENDLIIGDPNAPIRITVACNPYCGPCAKAHIELDTLVDKYSDKVCVQVRVLCSAANSKDPRTIAVNAIMQQVKILKNKNEIQEMLSNWFELMDYEKWKLKWNVKNNLEVNDLITRHEEWAKKSKISFTPTIFLNGKTLPGRYNIYDIGKMVPQLTESLIDSAKYFLAKESGDNH